MENFFDLKNAYVNTHSVYKNNSERGTWEVENRKKCVSRKKTELQLHFSYVHVFAVHVSSWNKQTNSKK